MKRKITAEEKARLIQWAKAIYTELDDDEIPTVLSEEFWTLGFEAGFSAAEKHFKKNFNSALLTLKISVLKEMNQEKK